MSVQRIHRTETLTRTDFAELNAPISMDFNPRPNAVSVADDAERADFQPMVSIALIEKNLIFSDNIQKAVAVQIGYRAGGERKALCRKSEVAARFIVQRSVAEKEGAEQRQRDARAADEQVFPRRLEGARGGV